MSSIVSNTSPLIVLAKAGYLDLLPKLFSQVIIPQAVCDEIQAGPPDDAMRAALPGCDWLHLIKLDPPLSPLAVMQLGLGEAEVIECARRQTDCAVILDDWAGRRTARALGLPTFGTLALVAISVRLGYLTSFESAVAQLRDVGFYVSDSVVEEVRRKLRSSS